MNFEEMLSEQYREDISGEDLTEDALISLAQASALCRMGGYPVCSAVRRLRSEVASCCVTDALIAIT